MKDAGTVIMGYMNAPHIAELSLEKHKDRLQMFFGYKDPAKIERVRQFYGRGAETGHARGFYPSTCQSASAGGTEKDDDEDISNLWSS